MEQTMRVNVKKWGNSSAVRIPSVVMDAADFRIDDTVDVRAEGGKIVIELVRETDYDLDQLLDRITPENLHGSIDFGGPVGKEAL
jgi:antitoxin MazE